MASPAGRLLMTSYDYAPGVEPSELQTLWSLSFEKTTRGIAIIEPGTRNLEASASSLGGARFEVALPAL